MFGDRVVGVALVSTSAGRLAEVTLGVPAAAARLLHRAGPGVVSALGRAPRLVELGRRTGNDLEFVLTRLYSFSSDVPPAIVDFVRQMNTATPIEVVADFFPAFDDHDKESALPVLGKVATLVLVGADDRLTPAEHSREIAEAVPGAVLVVREDCGHMIMLEYPEEVDAHLAGLLDRVTRPVSVAAVTVTAADVARAQRDASWSALAERRRRLHRVRRPRGQPDPYRPGRVPAGGAAAAGRRGSRRDRGRAGLSRSSGARGSCSTSCSARPGSRAPTSRWRTS